MATVPGPDPDKPLPRPGAPAIEPEYEPEEESFDPLQEDRPEWMSEPYDPSKEFVEPDLPAGVP
jgi:hypothetical protein